MRSAILEKGEEYYSYLGKIFSSIDNEQLNYNWLITNYECYPQEESVNEMFSREYLWISGEQLTEIIKKEDFQFIWGVFSGFQPTITLDEVLKYDMPYADFYGGFWIDDVRIQHPLADIEIVAFDSTLTLFISKVDKFVQMFRNYFPLSEDLSAKNKRNNERR